MSFMPSWIGDAFKTVLDPFDLFTGRANQDRADSTLALQRQSLQHQIEMDKWSQGMAERQMNLASTPVSSVVKDAASVGVNPMAALGQSVGSASIPSSNVQQPTGTSPVPNPLAVLLGTALSSAASLGSTKMNVNSQDEIDKRHNTLARTQLFLQSVSERHRHQEEMERINQGKEELTIKRVFAANDSGRLALDREKFVHDSTMDYKRYMLDKIHEQFYQKFSEKEFSQKVSEFNKEYDLSVRRLEEQIKSDKRNVTMQYVTRFGTSILSTLGSIFGPGASSKFTNFLNYIPHNSIGFDPNRYK